MTATLNESITRLEGIKEKKHLFNKSKIAEAEALAAEALRMANEAKLAAARLAEVKKTLALFSDKLETAEKSVQKDTKKVELVVEEAPVEEAPKEEATEEVVAAVEEAPKEEATEEVVAAVEEAPKEEEATPAETSEEEIKVDPSGVVSKSLINDDVVKVVEFKVPTPEAKDEPAEETPDSKVAPSQAPVESDIIEDFLDSLGVDKMCGLDDETLGFTDRPKIEGPVVEPEIFENPTRVNYAIQPQSPEELYLNTASWKEETATKERSRRNLAPKSHQKAAVNNDFPDPFGVDHDDLVLCGKIADLCEPPEYPIEDEVESKA